MADGLLLGLDIGGTKSAAIVGDASGHILAREAFTTGTPSETIAKLIELGRRLLAGRQPVACGVSCGGPLDSGQGLILSPPNLPGWDRVPVVSLVRQAYRVPTALENDANAAALAEWCWGLKRQIDDLIYLTCGTGMGAGMVLGGKLHRGRQDLAGEIGHVRLLPLGPVGYHKAGSVEGLTSGRGLGELAKLRLQEPHDPSALDALPAPSLTGQAVGGAALAGDAVAQAVVRELGGYLGQACAILIDVLNPQRISLGSMARRLGDLLLEPVRQAAQREALPAAFDACAIEPAVLGEEVQDLAALAAAFEAVPAKRSEGVL